MADTLIDSTADRWVYVGRSMASAAHDAGAEAAAQAQTDRPATLLIVFSSSVLDAEQVLAGVCSTTPDHVRIVGGTSMGEIAESGPGLEEIGLGSAVVVIALGGPGFELSTQVARGAGADRRAAGALVATALDGIDAPHQTFLMIADGLTGEQHELVRGVYSVLGASIPIVGGCSADNLEYVVTYQFHGTGAGVERLVDSVVGVGLGSNAPMGVGIAHGWAKQGEPMVVTSSEGGEIFLLDDKPALDVYLRRIGADRSLLADMSRFPKVTLQHPLGLSRRAVEDIRVVHSANPERGSLYCLADVPQGALVWTMSADPDALIAAAAQSCELAVADLAGSPPLGIVVFDCGARKLKLGPQDLTAEQAAIAKAAAGAPFGGFYTFGEIGRTQGARGMHHLTVVTLAFA